MKKAEINKAARRALLINMGLRKNETLLVVTNPEKEDVANAFFEEGMRLCSRVFKLVFPSARMHGEEPPGFVAEAMRKADVVVAPTLKSLSHTRARKNATKNGVRLASMPGVTPEMMARTLSPDYRKIRALTRRICSALEGSKKIRITTQVGTAIEMTIGARECHGKKGGIYDRKGAWGNLPGGEACFAPIEGKTNGVYIIDCGNPVTGRLLRKPIKVTVEKGFAVRFEGGRDAKMLENELSKHGRMAFNVAELGIGTNPAAKITGKVLEDEKALGTCHIALGNNKSFGGKVGVNVHLDGVIRNPTILADGKAIMVKGKIRI